MFFCQVQTYVKLQENISLTNFNFSDQKLLVTIIINLDTSLQSKNVLVNRVVIIMNTKL